MSSLEILAFCGIGAFFIFVICVIVINLRKPSGSGRGIVGGGSVGGGTGGDTGGNTDITTITSQS